MSHETIAFFCTAPCSRRNSKMLMARQKFLPFRLVVDCKSRYCSVRHTISFSFIFEFVFRWLILYM